MKKDITDHILVECVVDSAESNGFFKLHQRENPHNLLLGYISGKMRKNKIFIIPGDVVEVKLSIYDLSKGIICRRLHSGEKEIVE